MSTVVSSDSEKKAQKRQARQSRPLTATQMSAVVSRDSELLKSIPFNDIVAGAAVRLAEIDGVQYLSIQDVIMHVCGAENNYAGEIWRRMRNNELSKLGPFLNVFKFPGQQIQPVITLPGSIKLVMILPGKNAKRYKWIFADVISRYLDGDDEMCSEIKQNKSMGKKRSYEKFAQDMDRSIKEEDKSNKKNPRIGYVYATQSEAFPGLIKIGQTLDMKARLSQLNTACAPSPHVVVALAPTFNMDRDEKDAHQFFSTVRMQGEFFAVNKSQVKKYFHEHIMALHQEELLEYMQ